MIKTDTIVDFLQVIFKIIIKNLQISNTSASQNNNPKNIRKYLTSSGESKARGIIQNEKTWQWRYIESQFPTSYLFKGTSVAAGSKEGSYLDSNQWGT